MSRGSRARNTEHRLTVIPRTKMANHAHSVDAPIALLFHIAHRWRRATHAQRSFDRRWLQAGAGLKVLCSGEDLTIGCSGFVMGFENFLWCGGGWVGVARQVVRGFPGCVAWLELDCA